jgi:hypothetical protein
MLPKLDCSLNDARAHTDGDRLIVTTGKVRRTWRWTSNGFVTMSFADVTSGRAWEAEPAGCDWQMLEADDAPPADLRSLRAIVQDDEGFTSEHVCVTGEVAYPDANIVVKWQVWAYPGAPGIRTHLAAKAIAADGFDQPNMTQGGPTTGNVDRLPIGNPTQRRRLFGYYNATQQRNDTHQNILKEEVVSHPLMGRELCDWASAACIEDDHGGIALVKESHKCVNQSGYVSGGFIADEHEGLLCHGWGLRLTDVKPDAYTDGWATWSILWTGDDVARELAFKQFDHARYPIDPARDIYIQANTWGSTSCGEDARRAAGPDSVLDELEVCAELGIDVLQIDDGWQVPPGHSSWNPEDNGWHPHPEHYPDGWAPIRKRAEQLGVKLGLWAAAMPVSLEELQANFDAGGFTQYKLDFAVLRKREEIDELMAKVRAFIKGTGHAVRVNWDVTENPARYGYFFAREYGSIYLENRKPEKPIGVIYRPHTVLRDLWQIAKYLNLHRFQGSVQNVDRVDPLRSDARLHSHSYATAITLMGIPLFFQQTKYYSDDARAEIARVLAAYKPHREAIYSGIVYPIGDRPDNAGWTGFQCATEPNSGYLTIFRERCNDQPTHAMPLKVAAPGTIALTDLLSGQTTEQRIGDGRSIDLKIPDAPGFLFLKYDIPV